METSSLTCKTTNNSLPAKTMMAVALAVLTLAAPTRAHDELEDKFDRQDRRVSIFPLSSKPYGRSYGEWAGAWWNWALQFPYASDPITDDTGADGGRGQSGPVWFLAGTFGGTAERTLAVPVGKALFVPLFNGSWWFPLDVPTEAEARAAVTAQIDGATGLQCEIDGVAVQNPFHYRAASPPGGYTQILPEGSMMTDTSFFQDVFGVDFAYPAGETGAVADGYWLMLAPLPPGAHDIHIASAAPGFSLDVTYHLNVVQPAHIAPPKSRPFGKRYSEWAAKWWQWAYSFPADKNPVMDLTGDLAGLGQSGPVWFLAGTFGQTATRTIAVPEGKALFLPIIDTIWINIPEFGDNPWSAAQRDFARAFLAPFVDNAFNLSCQIDGLEVADLESYRSSTADGGEYPISFPENNVWGIPSGIYGPTIDDGIYLMVAPLRPGEHTIHFTAASEGSFAGSFALDVTYNISVLPRR